MIDARRGAPDDRVAERIGGKHQPRYARLPLRFPGARLTRSSRPGRSQKTLSRPPRLTACQTHS